MMNKQDSYQLEPLNDVDFEKKFQQNEKNRWLNVKTGYFLKFVLFFYFTSELGQMFDAFIYLSMDNQNKWIGYTEGLLGLSMVIVCIPAGILADIFKRHIFLRFLTFPIGISLVIALYAIITKNITLILVYVALYGISLEFLFDFNDAIVTVSLKRSERVKYLSYGSTISALALATSPLINIIYFSTYSNTWEIRVIQYLLITGICITFPFFIILPFFYRDVDPYMVEATIKNNDSPTLQLNSHETNTISSIDSSDTVTIDHNEKKYSDLEEPLIVPSQNKELYDEDAFFKGLSKTTKLVPILLLTQKIVAATGRGMAIKFTPFFLKEEYNFTPLNISILLLTQFLLCTVFTLMSPKVAKFIGRPETSLIIILLIGFSHLMIQYVKNVYWVVFFLILRRGLDTSSDPLDLSIMADYTKFKNRGKWVSVYSLGSFLWSGGAFFGGFIADQSNYRLIYVIAGIFSILSGIFYGIIIFALPKDDKKKSFE